MNNLAPGFPQRPGCFGNSLASHIIAGVDSRIGGKAAGSALAMYSTLTHSDSGPIEWNTSFWAYDLRSALTCVSPSNSATSGTRFGTLITPRHVLYAKHATPTDGDTIRFVQADNTVVTRTQSANAVVAATDFAVGLMSSDLPAGIVSAKVAPSDALTYLVAGSLVPLIVPDQDRNGRVREVTYIFLDGQYTTNRQALSGERAAFSEATVSGDSGGPWTGLINGEAVVFGTQWSSNPTFTDDLGPCTVGFISALNTAIADADTAGSVSTGYTVSEADFSGFAAI